MESIAFSSVRRVSDTAVALQSVHMICFDGNEEKAEELIVDLNSEHGWCPGKTEDGRHIRVPLTKEERDYVRKMSRSKK